MVKKQQFDYTKLLMFAVPLVIAVGTYFVLQYRVDAAEKKIEKVENKQAASDVAYAQVAVTEAKIQVNLENQQKSLDDIKDLLKDMVKK